jgi:hypothetical protein
MVATPCRCGAMLTTCNVAVRHGSWEGVMAHSDAREANCSQCALFVFLERQKFLDAGHAL